MKLAEVKYEVPVNACSEDAWKILARYGDVAEFHGGITKSNPVNGSGVSAATGADRMCELPNGRNPIVIWERIFDFDDGCSYTYDVYQWENFPLAKMQNTFGVRPAGKGKSVIYQHAAFRLKPGFLTHLMKGKLRKNARQTLLGYKHTIETGQTNADLKQLSKTYGTI